MQINLETGRYSGWCCLNFVKTHSWWQFWTNMSILYLYMNYWYNCTSLWLHFGIVRLCSVGSLDDRLFTSWCSQSAAKKKKKKLLAKGKRKKKHLKLFLFPPKTLGRVLSTMEHIVACQGSGVSSKTISPAWRTQHANSLGIIGFNNIRSLYYTISKHRDGMGLARHNILQTRLLF